MLNVYVAAPGAVMANSLPVILTTTLTPLLVAVSVTEMVAGLSAAETFTPPLVGHWAAVPGPALATGTANAVNATTIDKASRILRTIVCSSHGDATDGDVVSRYGASKMPSIAQWDDGGPLRGLYGWPRCSI